MPEFGDIQFTVQKAFVASFNSSTNAFTNPAEIEYAQEFDYKPLMDESELKALGANREKLAVVIGAESSLSEASMKAAAYNVAMGYTEGESGSSGNRIRTTDRSGGGRGKPYVGLIVVVMATIGQVVYGFPKSMLKSDQEFSAGINEFRTGELQFEHLVLPLSNHYMRSKKFESDGDVPDFSQGIRMDNVFLSPR
ncbi:MAG: hypothetical protein Q9P01_05795 [Anaerolineae bacterium]|nr:hypothetical protein [Anaerolineae bacterium]